MKMPDDGSWDGVVSLTSDEREVLDAWGMGAVLSSTTPDSGTLNRTLLLATTTGEYVLWGYRFRDREPVEREHAVIAHAQARGVPAVGPLPLPSGGTILERDGRFYALFPRASGHQIRRRDLGTREAAAMGACLAALHRALRDFPAERLPRRQFTPDRDATLAGIARLEEAIRRRGGGDATDAAALVRLADRRAWFEQGPADAPVDLTPLEHQAVHGDYQEANLFFEGGRVSAVIDWERVCVIPRAWEVVRTLDLAFAFAPDPCRGFLAAYRTGLPLPLPDLDLAAEHYGLMRKHGLWLYEALYLEGNERVRPLIHPGGFVPIAERWARLRPALEGEPRR
ncbi:MAG: phosphotransferase [Chloroflexota bacterium]|nr:phosphotransferase [Chloroflexota bacterium]